jgi:hypothetical protein
VIFVSWGGREISCPGSGNCQTRPIRSHDLSSASSKLSIPAARAQWLDGSDFHRIGGVDLHTR